MRADTTTLRAAVRGLNGVRTDLMKLGQELVTHHLRHKPNAKPVNLDDHLRGAAEQLHDVVELLRRER